MENKKVLIVEDSKPIANFEKNRIENILHYQCLMAYSLKEAEEIIGREGKNIFVALLDLCLPDAPDGEVVDTVMEHGIPVIVFTGELSDDIRDEMINKGVVDYILKGNPSNFDYALKLVRRLRNNPTIKALVVDDSKFMRSQIRKILEKQCFEVYEAADGDIALDILKEQPDIKLALIDENMPNMRGTELVERIRVRNNNDQLAIIGVSSHGSNLLAIDFLKRGASDFITKPFMEEELTLRIIQNIDMIDYIEMAKRSAITDFLTKLYNRKYLYETGQKLFENAKRQSLTITIAIVDIDFFKKVNDTYGHDVGDDAICHISSILKSNVRDGDIVARIGGEEFCVLAINMDRGHALKVFERIRKNIEETALHSNGHSINLTISTGISTRRADSFDAMIKEADEQLYVAKTSGRNRVEAIY